MLIIGLSRGCFLSLNGAPCTSCRDRVILCRCECFWVIPAMKAGRAAKYRARAECQPRCPVPCLDFSVLAAAKGGFAPPLPSAAHPSQRQHRPGSLFTKGNRFKSLPPCFTIPHAWLGRAGQLCNNSLSSSMDFQCCRLAALTLRLSLLPWGKQNSAKSKPIEQQGTPGLGQRLKGCRAGRGRP